MSMKTIAILNQKGGSGKTTISINMTEALRRQGKNVVLVDSDPQGSARDWAAAAEECPFHVVGIDRPTIDRDIKAITDRDFIIIDGAPQIANLAASAIKAADIVLIPVQPSGLDVWATADMVDIIKQRIEITEGNLKAAFVINRVIKNTKIGNEILTVIADYGLPVLETVIHQRVAYASTISEGQTIFQGSHLDAIKEMNDVINEVLSL